MKNFKEKLYNYEANPPGEIWQKINAELNKDAKVVLMSGLKKRPKFIFYGITVAASLVVIFLASILFNNPNKIKNAASVSTQSQNLSSQQIRDSIALNNKILEDIINSSKDKNLLALNYENSLADGKKYLTVAGPEGQPVKISPKVATLIESADNEYPPKPVWNKKIEKWKQIMLSSTLSPTSTNLLDIVQLSSINDKNE
jgi:hypothetical protein